MCESKNYAKMSEEKSKSTIPNIPKVHTMPASSTKEAPLKGHVGPSALRQLLPIISCLLSFASVLTVLIIYMDTTGEFSFFFCFVYLSSIVH